MFTGIVKELGSVVGLSMAGGGCKLSVRCEKMRSLVDIGDSVAVNGVCLTVAGKEEDLLYFDAVEETLRKTGLRRLKEGARLNLEDSIRAGDPMGGHFVLGHIDCQGKITDSRSTGNGVSIVIMIPEEFTDLIVEKGSIAVDGVSLTIGEIERNRFTVHIIPHTRGVTTLAERKAGEEVNIEFDILGKYILKHKTSGRTGGMTEGYLREKGFG